MALSEEMKLTLQFELKKYIETSDHNPAQFPSQVTYPFSFSLKVLAVGAVVQDLALCAEGSGFDYQGGESNAMSPTALHRCDVFSKLCCPNARPRRWAPLLVTRLDVTPRV